MIVGRPVISNASAKRFRRPGSGAVIVGRDVGRCPGCRRRPVPGQRGEPDGRIDRIADLCGGVGPVVAEPPIGSGVQRAAGGGRRRKSIGRSPAATQRLEERDGREIRQRVAAQPVPEPRRRHIEESHRLVDGDVRELVLPRSEDEALLDVQPRVVVQRLARIGVVPGGDGECRHLDGRDVGRPAAPGVRREWCARQRGTAGPALRSVIASDRASRLRTAVPAAAAARSSASPSRFRRPARHGSRGATRHPRTRNRSRGSARSRRATAGAAQRSQARYCRRRTRPRSPSCPSTTAGARSTRARRVRRAPPGRRTRPGRFRRTRRSRGSQG